jgi:hypothetical protein
MLLADCIGGEGLRLRFTLTVGLWLLCGFSHGAVSLFYTLTPSYQGQPSTNTASGTPFLSHAAPGFYTPNRLTVINVPPRAFVRWFGLFVGLIDVAS